MNKESIVNDTTKYWNAEYNCAQSTASGILDYYGFNAESSTLNKALIPFGGGVGERSICGSLLGALAALSFLLEEKGLINEQIGEKTRLLKDKFKEKNGSLFCRELLEDFLNPGVSVKKDKVERRNICDKTVETSVIIVKSIIESL